MSCQFASCTHIRAVVSGAVLDKFGTIPAPPLELLNRYPDAFGALARSPHYGARRWWLNYEDEFGRLLWLANADAYRARYTQPAQQAENDEAEAEALTYRHALVELSAPGLIAACDYLDYQCNEFDDWRERWAAKAINAIREFAIGAVTKGQPWGIPDPEGGPLVPGTAGAPVSLMSLVKR